MSKFFEDVGDVFTAPVKTIYNAVTNNPKGNSIGDIWNNTVGPGNPYQELASDAPGAQLYKKATGGDLSAPLSLPSWDALGNPGQAFAEHVDQSNKSLPTFVQPYAQPAESLALSAFNPFAGAAFNTAYQGGQEQANNKGFDWGELGKNAAINFGTAAVASGANKLLANANAADAAKTFSSGPDSLEASFNPGNNVNSLTSVGGNFAPQATSGALAANSASALNGISSVPSLSSAVDGFNPSLIGASQSYVPRAAALQSSGIGDAAYKAGINSGKNLINQTLDSTLAPQGAQPIAGALDSFDPTSTGSPTQSQWGDILNAFGGGEINTANPNGPRINDQAFNDSVNRLSANNYLQQNQTRDVALPAGQYLPSQNTPYANRLDEINKGTTQSYKDLVDQVNNANRYYGVIDSNPGLTNDQLDQFLNDPSQGVLGNFTVPQDQLDYFKNIRTLGPQNLSLTH